MVVERKKKKDMFCELLLALMNLISYVLLKAVETTHWNNGFLILKVDNIKNLFDL